MKSSCLLGRLGRAVNGRLRLCGGHTLVAGKTSAVLCGLLEQARCPFLRSRRLKPVLVVAFLNHPLPDDQGTMRDHYSTDQNIFLFFLAPKQLVDS